MKYFPYLASKQVDQSGITINIIISLQNRINWETVLAMSDVWISNLYFLTTFQADAFWWLALNWVFYYFPQNSCIYQWKPENSQKFLQFLKLFSFSQYLICIVCKTFEISAGHGRLHPQLFGLVRLITASNRPFLTNLIGLQILVDYCLNNRVRDLRSCTCCWPICGLPSTTKPNPYV